MRRIVVLAVWLLVTTSWTLGCNQKQPAVNRVQPNVVDKNVFEGEWYFLQTVIDTPYSASYTFVGEQGPLEKVKWEIQQDYLVARRSYEFVANGEPEGVAGATERGAPVAMYKIEKHFDIQREYNPRTGEELNVIVENSSDRPWYDRDYMRVDWSKNLITNNNFLTLGKLFNGITMEPVSYYVEEGTGHPHAPKFKRDSESGRVNYVDVVNKMFVEPNTVEIEGFGEIPSCMLMYKGHIDCAPGEITVRNSFMKVDPSSHYSPKRWTGERQDEFGYFVSERPGYNEEYGVVESSRMRFINRHDIWKQDYKRNEEGGLIRCTASTEEANCGSGPSECDVDFGRARRERAETGEWMGACTRPYRERETKPIVYHMSKNFPEDLHADLEHAEAEWDRAFRQTVASLRENECKRNGGDAEQCESQHSPDSVDQMFVLCDNPVTEDSHPACGEPGTTAEIGDLRYSIVGWVNSPHNYSPLGYGPSAADPETGELINGSAYIYGAGVKTLSSFARDIVALLNDDVDESQIRNGELVESWVERQQIPTGDAQADRAAANHVTSIDGQNVDRINDAMDFSWVHELQGVSPEQQSGRQPASVRQFLSQTQQSLRNLKNAGAFGRGPERGQARLQNLKGTDIERMMTGPEMRMMAGINPDRPVNDQVLDEASPLRGMDLGNIRALNEARERVLSQGSGCILNADFGDDGMIGLARAIERKAENGNGQFEWYGETYDIVKENGNLDYQAVRSMLRHPIMGSVVAHEIGHTIGLRHNFAGSYDSLNYKHRYWELRSDGDMAPRAWDPMTEEEIEGRIQEYQYSSVMDYGNNFVVTDALGIGHYDEAAIKMGYGDLVEVFRNAEDPRTLNWIHFIRDQGWPVALKLSSFQGQELSAYPYTEVPSVVGGIDRLEQRDDVPYESLEADPFLQRQGISDPMMDPQGRPVVPYRFCSDRSADLSPSCQKYDAGADQYEAMQSVMDKYWNYYIFNAYGRGELGFNTQSYAQRVLGRYFSKLKYANQVYSLYRTILEENFGGTQGFDSFWTRQDGMGAYTAGVGAAFEMLTRVVTAPEPGTYQEETRGNGTEAYVPGRGGGLFGGSAMRVDAFDGRYLETTWNFDNGYYWQDQLERAGYMYDKLLATQVLTDPQTNFIGRDTAADIRRYQINFYSSFGPSVTGFFRGLMGSDWKAVAPRVSEDAEGLKYPDPLNLTAGNELQGRPIDPNASFTVQLYAAVFSMGMIPETFDQTYMNKARVWVRGGAEGVDINPEVPTVEFTDPNSGLTYVAASYPNENGVETAPGARMVLHAKTLAQNGADGELQKYLDNIDLIRRLSWLLEFGS